MLINTLKEKNPQSRHTPVIRDLGRLGEEGCSKFQDSLGYKVSTRCDSIQNNSKLTV